MDANTIELALAALAGAVAVGAAVWLALRRRAPGPTGPGAGPVTPPAAEVVSRGLQATSRRLLEQIAGVFARESTAGERVRGLEETLIAADVGLATTQALLERVRDRLAGVSEASDACDVLRSEVEAMMEAPPPPAPTAHPWVVLVMGVNGVGKTTTIGKLAARHQAAGRKVLLVAADTFRAAAIDQLGVWAERVGADIVRHAPGGDPAAVVFDGLKAAKARNVDVVLVDTAGRLHTKSPLMAELGKLRRVIEREVPGAPHEVLLVLDATTGQNALSQARTFTGVAQVTGLVLTKLDGTARGGVALALRRELGIPLRYIGVGESADDLRPFDAQEFASALFGA